MRLFSSASAAPLGMAGIQKDAEAQRISWDTVALTLDFPRPKRLLTPQTGQATCNSRLTLELLKDYIVRRYNGENLYTIVLIQLDKDSVKN